MVGKVIATSVFKFCTSLFVVFLFLSISPKPSFAKQQGGELTGEQVRRSIDRGVRFLLSKKSNRGWDDFGEFKYGTTALATLALLNSGIKPDDPRIGTIIDRLSRAPLKRTYVVSLITMVLAKSNPKKYRRQIADNVKWLQDAQKSNGGWGYGAGPGVIDSSNSQFAILALHEAQQVRVDVELKTWEKAKRYWEAVYSNEAGGFRYNAGESNSASGSMTCAGISSMIIINENLNLGSSQIQNGQVVCCGRSQSNEMIEQSIRWLGKHFKVSANPGAKNVHRSYVYYYRYSVERAGRLTGQRFFERRDWYREIADGLIGRKDLRSTGFSQQVDGSWAGKGGVRKVISTSLAVLFLSKGLRPIVASKYQYSEGSEWNRHPRGIHYLARFTEQVWQTKLNWQTIDGRKAKVNDLLETPVMMISGDGPMNLSKQQKENLKSYIDNGGFLFFEANLNPGCPNARAFNDEVREMLAEWFPGSKLKVLSADHSVWTSQFQVKPNPKFPLLGIESCCRTSVVFCAAPISGFWQLKTPVADRLPRSAKKDVDYASKLGVNILAFATGNVLKDRLDRPKIHDKNLRSVIGRQMAIGKLRHNAGYNDAPSALGNLIRRSNVEKGLQFKNQASLIHAESKNLAEHPILFVHGRGKIVFSKEQRVAIAEHLDRGGFVFGDAICGNKEFYQSFKLEMLQVVEGAKWEKLTSDHPIFRPKYNGYNIVDVKRRTRNSRGKFLPSKAELDGIKIGDRYQVLFSEHDLSCALENGTNVKCYGYSKDDATRIGINILLYALHP